MKKTATLLKDRLSLVFYRLEPSPFQDDLNNFIVNNHISANLRAEHVNASALLQNSTKQVNPVESYDPDEYEDNIKDVAKSLDISYWTLKRMIENGEVSATKAGKRRYTFSRTQIERIVLRKTR